MFSPGGNPAINAHATPGASAQSFQAGYTIAAASVVQGMLVSGVHKLSAFGAITQGGAWSWNGAIYSENITLAGGGNETLAIKTYNEAGAVVTTSSFTGPVG